MKTRVNWTVSLSNGETVYEGKGNYQVVEGELSPWQKLQEYLKNGISITSISLYDGERRFNLPSAGKNPKFKAFDDAEKPVSYNFFRKVGADVIGGHAEDYEVFAVIEANYLNKTLQLWVSENNPNNCWVLV